LLLVKSSITYKENSTLFGRMPSSGVLRRVAFVRTDFTEERSASVIRVARIGELGTLAVTSNGRETSNITQ
jgi:hypothetical protein